MVYGFFSLETDCTYDLRHVGSIESSEELLTVWLNAIVIVNVALMKCFLKVYTTLNGRKLCFLQIFV